MSGFDELRSRLGAGRSDLQDAESAASRTRWSLAEADASLAEARRTGDTAAITSAEAERNAAEAQHGEAVRRWTGLRNDVLGGLSDFVDHLPGGAAGVGDAVLAGVDQNLPIALLPVRLETRFAGPTDAPVLKVRIYPDDLHIDDHEPDLTQEEADRGRAYWTSVRAGDPEADAWTSLAGSVGPYRALWVRAQLQPVDSGSPPTFPDVQLRPAGTSRAAVARGLPDLFLVRVRAGGTTTITPGGAVADSLQVGVDLSGDTAAATAPTNAPGALTDDVVVLGEDARWLSDFAAAKEAGMAVEVPLPAGTERVDEVAVLGVSVSLTPDDATALVHDLVERQRVTHGAGFVPPGTPTNNLADTTSGWLSRPDPARLDPAARPVAPPASNATAMATALGATADEFTELVGAADADAAESEVMALALFEATWGPFLRTQAQPGFPLRLLPQAHAHVTRWLKGGGPLPTLRLGRQPYGVLPIQPHQQWAAMADDDELTGWLADYLPRIRALWLAGAADAPSGPAVYTHEAVSSRFRVRTTNASSTRPWALQFGLGDGGDEGGVQERRLVAELQLGEVLPMVLSQIFTKIPVNLWMPVSNDDDLDFLVADPKPKEATSVLGLLLRNAALQVTTNIADELLTPARDAEVQGYAAAAAPSFALTDVSGLAVSASPEISVTPMQTLQDKLSSRFVDADGTEMAVSDKIQELAAQPHGPLSDLSDYLHTDAFLSYSAAHADLAAIPSERRARLAGEVLDCASHRYDAWVTSLATRRLAQLRAARPTGVQLGAWGVVTDVWRRRLTTVDRDDLPSGTVSDPANRGFVVAPSLQHANVAGVLRAAWIAHNGPAGDAEAPFAVDLRSERLRQAVALADGMRNGQQLGALLGYQLERGLHDASGNGGVEVDWAVYVLRRTYPLMVGSAENAGLPSERMVVDGWRVVQDALQDLGSVVDAVVAEVPSGIDAGTSATAIRAAVVALIGALDGLTDLGLAESVHQLAGANFARAGAATDMISRAAVPPDTFDVAGTPRGGRGIDQRLVAVFGGLDRPAGYARSTPRATLAPAADAFVARRLGKLTGITVRLLDADSRQVATSQLADLGMAALDLAADAASTGGAAPFPLLLARARDATGHAEATSVGLDPETDQKLVELLDHAARWHQALAGRRPLSPATFVPRGSDAPADPDALAQVTTLADQLDHLTGGGAGGDLDLDALTFWGIDPHTSQSEAKATVVRRLAEARAASDPATAARTLLGGDAVVTGTVTVTEAAPWTADQKPLGVARSDLAGWVQDTGRVREAAQRVDEALLLDELSGASSLVLAAGQTPAVAGRVDPAAPAAAVADARRWVGQAFPGPLGNQPVVSFVTLHDHHKIQGAKAGDSVTGIELDAWVEVVPDRSGAGAVAANLASPDSRAPNTILLAVPADVGEPWTQASLFSVIDEALELAECRLVDLDASRRVPAVLPAIYISEFDDDLKWRDVVHQRVEFPTRYVAKGVS